MRMRFTCVRRHSFLTSFFTFSLSPSLISFHSSFCTSFRSQFPPNIVSTPFSFVQSHVFFLSPTPLQPSYAFTFIVDRISNTLVLALHPFTVQEVYVRLSVSVCLRIFPLTFSPSSFQAFFYLQCLLLYCSSTDCLTIACTFLFLIM